MFKAKIYKDKDNHKSRSRGRRQALLLEEERTNGQDLGT